MNIRTAVTGVLICVLTSTDGCTERFEVATDSSPAAIESTATSTPGIIVTRTEPVHVWSLTAAEVETPVDFVEIELTRNVNPNRIPVYFELRLKRSGEMANLLGTFAPFPPDNVGIFLVALTKPFAPGDHLELSLLTVDPERSGDVRITLAPIRLKNR